MDQDGDFLDSQATGIWLFQATHKYGISPICMRIQARRMGIKKKGCVSFGTGHPSHPMAKVVLEKMPLEYACP